MSKEIIFSEKQCKIIASLIKISAILMKNPNSHFKIGKTGDLKNRLDSEYRMKYKRIIEIYEGDDSDFISSLEEVLIKYYKEYYPDLCDNQNEGEHETEDKSFNCVYMVIE